MSHFFLGRWWHWLVLVAIVGLLWLAGANRLHVTEFNTFILSLLVGTAVVVTGLLLSSTPGERLTRDELPEPEDPRDGRSEG